MDQNYESFINQSIEKLEGNEELIKNQREEFNSIIKEQETMFLTLAEKVKPIIDHIKNKGYRFNSREFDCNSFRGPVIGRKDNIMFVYEGKGVLVTRYDLYSNEKKEILLVDFLATNSLKSAMDALLNVTNIQNEIISGFKQDIEIAKNELEIFK